MTPNNNIMILPFYNDLNKQSRYKKEALGVNYQLFSPINYILPFQFDLPTGYFLNYIQLISCEDNIYSEYNVTLEVPKTVGYYTLDSAIIAVPISERKLGLQVTFAVIDSSTKVYTWFTFKYTGTNLLSANWENINNWIPSSNNFNNTIASVKAADMSIVSFNTYNLFINKGITSLNVNIRGQGYLRFVFQLNGSASIISYFSEMFTFSNLTSDCIKIEYWNDDNFYAGDKIILYDNDTYKNKLYIQSNINKPTYEFTENGTEKDGYLNIESIISKKSYNFAFPAPEFICDAIRLIGMHDHISINYNGEEYQVYRFIPDPKWENSAYLANININFECNTVFRKISKATSAIDLGAFDNSFDSSFNN